MKKRSWVIVLSCAVFCLGAYCAYAQELPEQPKVIPEPERPKAVLMKIKKVDVNKDGVADVTYYYDDEGVKQAEADTNFDGKKDVTIYTVNGKFDSAEVDSNHDGKVDKKFDKEKEFKAWLNKNNPQFNDSLGWSDWSYQALKF